VPRYARPGNEEWITVVENTTFKIESDENVSRFHFGIFLGQSPLLRRKRCIRICVCPPRQRGHLYKGRVASGALAADTAKPCRRRPTDEYKWRREKSCFPATLSLFIPVYSRRAAAFAVSEKSWGNSHKAGANPPSVTHVLILCWHSSGNNNASRSRQMSSKAFWIQFNCWISPCVTHRLLRSRNDRGKRLTANHSHKVSLSVTKWQKKIDVQRSIVWFKSATQSSETLKKQKPYHPPLLNILPFEGSRLTFAAI